MAIKERPPRRDARWESAQVPLILGAGALVLMAAATTWIAHRISGRIHRLEHQVARIAEGDFRELALTRSRHATRSTTWPGRSTGCAPSFGR